jgi:hypothetical protein
MAIASHTQFRLSFAPLLGLLLLLSACNSTPKPAECDENQGVYLKAQEGSPLQPAPGLEAPDKRNALTIPANTGKSVDPKVCLQQAPSYFGTAGRIAASPEEMVADWAQAWADRNSTAVLAMYSSQFETDAPAGGTAWLAQRGAEVANGPLPNPRVTNLQIVQQGNDRRLASFTQQFGSVVVRKELNLLRDAGLWKISGERVTSSETAPDAK